MQALERHAFENYSITLVEMMQNAGKAVFDVVVNEIKPIGSVLVVAGKGNNGGDALVTARLLHEKGIDVTVFTTYPVDEFGPMARVEFDKLKLVSSASLKSQKKENSHLRLTFAHETKKLNFSNFHLIIDALFGFSLKGNPRPPANKIIEQILCSSFGSAQDDKFTQSRKVPVLSVDVPSGLDVHDGSVTNPTARANYTVALGMLKKGFEEHQDIIGKVYLGDLGIPGEAYRDIGYEAPDFEGGNYIKIN